MSDDDAELNYALAQRELERAIEQLKKFESIDQERRNSQPPHCSFCGRGKNEVVHMVKGTSAYICNECVERIKGMMEKLDSDN